MITVKLTDEQASLVQMALAAKGDADNARATKMEGYTNCRAKYRELAGIFREQAKQAAQIIDIISNAEEA